MAKSRWQKWLDLITPKSGRVRCEDGEWENFGDWYQAAAQTELARRIVGGTGSILSIRMTGLAGDGATHYFVIDIPPGKELFLFSRTLNLTQGAYNIDAIAVDTINLEGATVGASAPLDKVDGQSIDTVLRHTTNGVTGAVVREFGFADTGTAQTGQARAGGTSSVDGVIKRLSGPSILRVVKPGSGSFTANLVYACWEVDADE